MTIRSGSASRRAIGTLRGASNARRFRDLSFTFENTGIGTSMAAVGCLDRKPNKDWAVEDLHETDHSLVRRSAYYRYYFTESVWDHLTRAENAKMPSADLR